MKIYIDLFFIFNVLMDFGVILSTSIILKRNTSYYRIIISSIIGGILSILMLSTINRIVIILLGTILIPIIAFKYKGIRYTISNILYMYLISTLLGGIFYLFNIKVTNSIPLTYLIMLVITGEILILYIKENKKIKNIYNNFYKIDIYFKDNSSISITGFLDTGNNLYDPYKKRPVIIVSNKYKKEDKTILVPYHTIAGESLLECVRINKLYIDNKKVNKDVLVGFSDKNNFTNGVEVILHKDIMKG